MLPIRLGLLVVPKLDVSITDALVLLLRQRQIPFVLIQEAGAGSQRNWIEEILCRWSDEDELDLILTIGGTLPAPGPGQAECVPEVTRGVAERLVPGLSEAMRSHASKETPLALLDRGIAAIRGRTLLINLPAGAAAAILFLESIVELIPAIIGHLREDKNAPRIEDDLELIEDEMIEEADTSSASLPGKRLNPEEFAKFLQRRADNTSGG